MARRPSKAFRAIPENWISFLVELGRKIPVPVEVHCAGMFAAAARYGMPMQGDVLHYIATLPPRGVDMLKTFAESDSDLARKSGLCLRFSGVDFVEDYDRRLRRLFSTTFVNLRLYALEAHDLVLTQLGAQPSGEMAIADYLVRAEILKPGTLWRRYRRGLRPYVAQPKPLDSKIEKLLKLYF